MHKWTNLSGQMRKKFSQGERGEACREDKLDRALCQQMMLMVTANSINGDQA